MRNQSSHSRTDWTHSFSTSEVRRQRHQVLEMCAPSAKTLGGGRRERSIAQILRNPLFSPQPRSKHRLEDRKRMQEGTRGFQEHQQLHQPPSCNGHHLRVPVEPQEGPKQYNQTGFSFFVISVIFSGVVRSCSLHCHLSSSPQVSPCRGILLCQGYCPSANRCVP